MTCPVTSSHVTPLQLQQSLLISQEIVLFGLAIPTSVQKEESSNMEKELLKWSKAELSWGWHNGGRGAKGEGRDDREFDGEGTMKKRRRQ